MVKRPEGSRELLKNIRVMRRFLRSVREPQHKMQAEKLLNCYERPVRKAVRDLRIASNPVSWLLSSDEKRQCAMAAFNYLFDVLTIGLGPEIQKLSEK